MLEVGLLCKSFRPHFINDTKRRKKKKIGKGKCSECKRKKPQPLLAADEMLQLPRGERVKIAFFLYFPRGTDHLLSGLKADKPERTVSGYIASCVPHPWFWCGCRILSQSYYKGPSQNNFSKFSQEDRISNHSITQINQSSRLNSTSLVDWTRHSIDKWKAILSDLRQGTFFFFLRKSVTWWVLYRSKCICVECSLKGSEFTVECRLSQAVGPLHYVSICIRSW